MWKRRSAILCQIAAKAETDLDFLYACIEPSLGLEGILPAQGDRLGAARNMPGPTRPRSAATSPPTRTRLSGLSRREALKNVGAGA